MRRSKGPIATLRSEEHEVRFWHTHCGRRATIALFLCAVSPPTPCLPRRKSCSMPERGGLRPPPPSCIDTSSAHAAPTRTRPRRGPRAMHMPTQVRMHACASEWPSVFLRVCASVCAANVSLRSVSRRAAHTPKHHTYILHVLSQRAEHVPRSAARWFVRSTHNNLNHRGSSSA